MSFLLEACDTLPKQMRASVKQLLKIKAKARYIIILVTFDFVCPLGRTIYPLSESVVYGTREIEARCD